MSFVQNANTATASSYGEKNITKFEMRAPPRRRQKLSEDGACEQDQPVFLRKAYKMISSCPPDIGGWSEKGDTMVIKDIKRFAETIIPTAYKHNNFSSFVRQLNFYGFRKIKSESIDRTDWWEFRHPQFQKDQPHLLSEIKRSVHFESGSNQEVSTLKTEVTGLNDRIDALHKQIDALSGVVECMKVREEEKDRTTVATVASAGAINSDNASETSKKRKVSYADKTPSAPVLMRQTSLGASSSSVPSGQDLLLDSGNFFNGFLNNNSNSINAINSSSNTSVPPALPVERVTSFQRMMSIASDGTDSAWIDDLGFLDERELTTAEDNEEFFFTSSSNLPQASAVPGIPASGAVQDISTILESLTPELKVRFVDKLAEVMGKQLTSNIAQQQRQQVAVQAVPAYPQQQYLPTTVTCKAEATAPAVTMTVNPYAAAPPVNMQLGTDFSGKMPSASVPTASSTYRLPSGEQAPEIALPLASAALGAFVLSSLQSLVNSQQQAGKPSAHIKEEVM